MTRQIDLQKLKADPIASVIQQARGKVVTFKGFVRSADGDTITLVASRESDTFYSIERDAIVGAFEGKTASCPITFVIRADASITACSNVEPGNIGYLARSRAPGHGVTCKSDDGSQTCACLPGERCVKGSTWCRCEDASGAFPGVALGGSGKNDLRFPGSASDPGFALSMERGAEVQPDGSIIYKTTCRVRWAWVCTRNGCYPIPYTECITYPEFQR